MAEGKEEANLFNDSMLESTVILFKRWIQRTHIYRGITVNLLLILQSLKDRALKLQSVKLRKLIFA